MSRPRSSKGFRGNAQPVAGVNQTVNHGHVGALGIPHQLNSHQASQANLINNGSQQKLIMSKSEERNLKSQGNSRQIMKPANMRQKTAAANNGIITHTGSNFHKDPTTQKTSAILSLNSHLQSQSSTQLPSAQITEANVQKLTKKAKKQFHQQVVAASNANQQVTPINQSVFNSQSSSLTNINKNHKLKVNYEDFKKFLQKEQYNNGQAQQIMMQYVQVHPTSLVQDPNASKKALQKQQTAIGGKLQKGLDNHVSAIDLINFNSQGLIEGQQNEFHTQSTNNFFLNDSHHHHSVGPINKTVDPIIN